MYFLKLLKKNRLFYALLMVLSLLNSFFYSSILFLINNEISTEKKDFGIFNIYLPELFFTIIIVSLICRRYFQSQMIHLTNDVIFEFEVAVLDKIRKANFETFRAFGTEKVYTVIGDTKTIAQLPQFFTGIINALVGIFFSFGYLVLIAPISAIATLAFCVGVFVFYSVSNRKVQTGINELRELDSVYHRHLHDLLFGFKEIKMSLARSNNIFTKFLEKNRLIVRNLEKDVNVKYMNNELITNYGWLLILGFVVFLMPIFVKINQSDLVSSVVIILYLVSSISIFVGAIPFLTKVWISIKRLESFDQQLNNLNEELTETTNGNVRKFEEIIVENVCYRYDSAHLLRRPFNLGPINLRIRVGETIFITGHNGSGKSTFVNILAGLCLPTQGNIIVDSLKIESRELPLYRNLIATIFTDAYMFSENYENYQLTKNSPKLREYIRLMQLEDILEIDEKNNFISKNLSKGQQKRLLLIYALLEDKPIFIFDEWAAEQDPEFRVYFYHTIIPFLKNKGKTLIAVTHDDRYFDCADRILQFANGEIENQYEEYELLNQ